MSNHVPTRRVVRSEDRCTASKPWAGGKYRVRCEKRRGEGLDLCPPCAAMVAQGYEVKRVRNAQA